MKIVVIQSGSKGNATLLIDKGRVLLIDMGISYISLKDALAKLNLNVMNIECLLLTHEHCDHTSGMNYLGQIPVYCTLGTYDSEFVIPLIPYKECEINGLKVTPVSTSHDVKDPIGFVFENEKEKFVYVTDTGKISMKTLKKMKNADYYVIESNHDETMLMNTNRPMFLKQRILSNKGHLSNSQSAKYMTTLIGPKTKQIILAHLSLEANTPQLAISTYKNIFNEANVSLNNIELKCANQFAMVEGGNI